MPTFVRHGHTYEYLSEEEMLAIANKIRESGAANVLDAFMPSIPNAPAGCLIANALNFGCSVAGYQGHVHPEDRPWPTYTYWGMNCPNRETAEMVGNLMGWDVYGSSVKLPVEVGNVAAAFDYEQGWTRKYNKHLPEEYRQDNTTEGTVDDPQDS